MEFRGPKIILALLNVYWIFMVILPCIGDTKDDLVAIRDLLLTFEQGYEQRDVDKYVSVFSRQEYEYLSDVTTPDDPSDDISLTGVEDERRSAIRVFEHYENIDLEVTSPEIKIYGDSAEAKNEIKITFVTFENPNFPIYFAASSNTFRLKKTNSRWEIVRWQQHEMSAEEMVAREQEEQKYKGVEDLIRDLGNSYLRIWVVAMSKLRKERETAVGALINALHSSDKNVRIRSAKVLCGIQDEDAVRELVGILEDEKDDLDVRIAAVKSLVECDGQMVDKALFKAAKGDKPGLKSAAFLALARRLRKRVDDLCQIAATGLQHEDKSVRKAAAETLGIIASVSSAALLEGRFNDSHESEDVRLAALRSLGQLKSESAIPLFKDVLKDKTEILKIREYAAHSLAETSDTQSLELLVNVAKNEKETFELRKEAISGLGTMGNTKATKPLIGLLNSSDADIRQEAAKSLEQLGDRHALKPLMMLLMNRDENIFARHLAGRGIVKIDRDLAFGPLAQILEDETESAPARRMAAEILVSSKYDQSAPLFIQILKDKEQPWWFRKFTADCLVRGESSIAKSSCVEALETAAGDADERVSATARDILKRMNSRLSAGKP